MTHYINLDEISKQFYSENEILRHDAHIIKELVAKTEKQKQEFFEQVAQIESLYKVDHAQLTQFKHRLKSDIKFDLSNLIEFFKDSHRIVSYNTK